MVEAVQELVDIRRAPLVKLETMLFKLVPPKEQRREFEVTMIELDLLIADDGLRITGKQAVLLAVVEVLRCRRIAHRPLRGALYWSINEATACGGS